MISDKRLATFGEVKEEIENGFYVQGEVSRAPRVFPTLMDDSRTYLTPREHLDWKDDMMPPKRLKRIPGGTIPRYQTGLSLRKEGKARILRNLQIIPPAYYQTQWAAGMPWTRKIPTQPTVLIDGVPNYEEIPFGESNSFGQEGANVERNWWGELVGGVEKVSSQLIGVERAKYEARLAEVQAQQASLLPQGSIIPYVIIGGIVLYLLKGKRR